MSTLERRSASGDDVGRGTAERFAREHPGLVRLGRVGWVAKGVVYGLTGLLAVMVAFPSVAGRSGSGQEASPSGAVAAIADTSGGPILLVLIGVGLLLYSAWRVVTVVLPAGNDAEVWAARIGYAASAVIYVALAVTALSFARDAGSGGGGRGGGSGGQGQEDSRIEELTRSVLDDGLGRILVGVVGVAVIALGVYFVRKGFISDFADELEPGGVGPVSHGTLMTMGRLGWVGRGLMLGLIGFFVTRAAVTFDPDDAQGLDGSLRKASESGFGTALVVAVAVGLVLYGAFCVLSAPRRRLVSAN